MNVCVRARDRVHVCAYVCGCVCMCARACMHVRGYQCGCVWHACDSAHVRVPVCMRAAACACMHVCMCLSCRAACACVSAWSRRTRTRAPWGTLPAHKCVCGHACMRIRAHAHARHPPRSEEKCPKKTAHTMTDPLTRARGKVRRAHARAEESAATTKRKRNRR
jgi:hypothetical protein